MRLYLFILLILSGVDNYAQTSIREDILLNDNWRTIVASENQFPLQNAFSRTNIKDDKWEKVNVPHNWDSYAGYRRLLHGNLHGVAWYRKKFSINEPNPQKRFFLFFEGVSSYAEVYLNGKKVGEHAGGRTTFTIDIT
ncbi:MAG: sugar-binding domain-containing protein, partial [Chitinophagaceae bacterium]